MRSGDIEALRNKMRDEGRPMKSRIINNGSEQIFWKDRGGGKVEITEKLQIGEREKR